MREQIGLHLGVHFRFFRRNRLLIAVAAVFLAITGISLTGALLFSSSTSRFESIRSVSGALNGVVSILVPAMGLFLVSSHLRNRNLKMVFTKPSTPEVWVFSGLLAAILVGCALHLLVWLVSVGLSLAWGIPVQAGFLFTALDSLFRSAILLGYLLCLAVVMHPVVAVLVIFVLNESAFYGLMFMMEAAIRATGGNPFLPALREVFRLVYMIIPITDPLSERSREVAMSLRVEAGDWRTLLMRAGYTLVVLTFFYLLSTLGLRRRNLS
jgi:ABC-type transport system involved in multi-copper enzyme maturation permease subunit